MCVSRRYIADHRSLGPIFWPVCRRNFRIDWLGKKLGFVRCASRILELQITSPFLLQEHYFSYFALSDIYLIHTTFQQLVILPSAGKVVFLNLIFLGIIYYRQTEVHVICPRRGFLSCQYVGVLKLKFCIKNSTWIKEFISPLVHIN